MRLSQTATGLPEVRSAISCVEYLQQEQAQPGSDLRQGQDWYQLLTPAGLRIGETNTLFKPRADTDQPVMPAACRVPRARDKALGATGHRSLTLETAKKRELWPVSSDAVLGVAGYGP